MLRSALADHLSNLRWQGLITEWHDMEISPGAEWEEEIAINLESADIILLLITSNFMASYYCHEVEMKRAIERHRENTARVIPIHLKRVDWENAPFSKLQALPSDAKPVSEWRHRDQAYYDICEGIKKVVNRFLGYPEKPKPRPAPPKRVSYAGNRAFADVGYQAAPSKYKRKLPPLPYDEPSLGVRIQDFLCNFSFRAFQRRSHSYLVGLLFTFGVLDLFVLPYFVSQAMSLALGIIAFFVAAILFIMATFSKHSAIGAILTFVFFIVWTLLAALFFPHAYHLTWSFPAIFLASFIISLLRLELFRKH